MSRPSPADSRAARKSPFTTLRDGALMAGLFSLAIAAVMGAAMAGAPRSSLTRLETVLWVWAALLLVVIATRRGWIDQWFRTHRTGGFIATLVICAFATWFTLAPNLEARFGVIDDHVILSQIGLGQKRLQWRQWPERIRDSEAFSFGTKGRYRPAYSALQLAECCWWGREVRRWYLAHITLCAVALIFLTRAGARVLGFTLAIAGSMALLGTNAFANTYCQLGPAEAYGMAALALGIWALAKACRGDGVWCWWLTLAGFGLASMCKENFVPVSGLACAVGAFFLPRSGGSPRRLAWFPLGLLTLHTLFMLALIARVLLATKQDIYSNPVGAGSYGTPLAAAAVTLLFRSPLTALWPLLGWSLWMMRRGRKGAGPLFSKPALAFGLVALAVWFSQAAFYRDNAWPPGSRYDLPGMIVPVALLLFGAWHLLRLLGSEPENRIATSALFIGLMFAGGNGAVNQVRAEAVANATTTRHFASWVDKLAKVALEDPNRVIVLVPERPLNHYEMLSSVIVYLRHKKVVNPIVYTTRFLGQPVGIAKERALFKILTEGTNSKSLTLRNDLAPDSNALFVPFGTASATALAGGPAKVYPKSLDEVLRKPAQ